MSRKTIAFVLMVLTFTIVLVECSEGYIQSIITSKHDKNERGIILTLDIIWGNKVHQFSYRYKTGYFECIDENETCFSVNMMSRLEDGFQVLFISDEEHKWMNIHFNIDSNTYTVESNGGEGYGLVSIYMNGINITDSFRLVKLDKNVGLMDVLLNGTVFKVDFVWKGVQKTLNCTNVGDFEFKYNKPTDTEFPEVMVNAYDELLAIVFCDSVEENTWMVITFFFDGSKYYVTLPSNAPIGEFDFLSLSVNDNNITSYLIQIEDE